ncbi:MAG TPA: CehA/McbA family metallohydrolase [bacterium]|nr:CehA/McbA family metallohydrolase [bacterium]
MPRKKRNIAFLLIFLIFIHGGCAVSSSFSKKYIAPRSESPNRYRGVFHVHSVYSHDSVASLDFIEKTTERAGLDFAVVTDHNTLEGAGIKAQEGKSSGPTLIFGNEISTVDGHLIALGIREPVPGDRRSQNLIDWIHGQGGYAILAHPAGIKKPWTNWQIRGWDGMELYNFADDFYRGNKAKIILKAIFLPGKYFLSTTGQTPAESLMLWHDQLKSRSLVAFGGTNAHLRWKVGKWTPENFLLYFRSVTTYVYADKADEKTLVRSLGEGRSFVALEAHGSAENFFFFVTTPRGIYWPGDSLTLEPSTRMSVKVPKRASIRLYLNGENIKETTGMELHVEPEKTGRYHVEVYDGEKLWIFTNPIHIKT